MASPSFLAALAECSQILAFRVGFVQQQVRELENAIDRIESLRCEAKARLQAEADKDAAEAAALPDMVASIDALLDRARKIREMQPTSSDGEPFEEVVRRVKQPADARNRSGPTRAARGAPAPEMSSDDIERLSWSHVPAPAASVTKCLSESGRLMRTLRARRRDRDAVAHAALEAVAMHASKTRVEAGAGVGVGREMDAPVVARALRFAATLVPTATTPASCDPAVLYAAGERAQCPSAVSLRIASRLRRIHDSELLPALASLSGRLGGGDARPAMVSLAASLARLAQALERHPWSRGLPLTVIRNSSSGD